MNEVLVLCQACVTQVQFVPLRQGLFYAHLQMGKQVKQLALDYDALKGRGRT